MALPETRKEAAKGSIVRRRRALITGITGQDGSYLAELLLAKNYEVHGIVRRSSSFNTGRIDHLYRDPHGKKVDLKLHFADMTDGGSLERILWAVQPDEVYNLGAQSHVRVSFDIPEYTGDVVALGATRMLEAIRRLGVNCHYYQASSSELFGRVLESPQRATTPFRPQSPYAAAKAYAFYMTKNYREAYGMYAVNGILFNHESERRGETFVTRKITRAVGRIKVGLQKELFLGNLAAKRDWGHAEDYVRAMWMMLQPRHPHDFVIGTGEVHSVEDFLTEAFRLVDLDWADFVKHDSRYERPTEVDYLKADITKARTQLGWEPRVTFRELVKRMVEHDLDLAERERRAL